MVEVSAINISVNQHSPSLSVRTAISPTLAEEFIIHPSVYAEIKKLGHAKSDVLLSESGSSLGADSVLCKRVNGAIKTSSVDFNSQSPTPSPMKSKHSRFAMLRRIFEPWQWKRRKKRDRLEQTSRTLERKISKRSTKEEFIKKDILMPDGTDKDQDSKINDSVHPTVLSSSQNHAMPVKNKCFPVEPSGCRRGAFTWRNCPVQQNYDMLNLYVFVV
ncbi:phosphatase and actin regulator 2 [Trichonephila clavipes]|nr:phosphatase and actin regulator 2 [Trichonephila clavipes]